MEALSVVRQGGGAPSPRAAAGSGLAPWLLGLLVAACAFAAFSSGAIDIPAESRLQLVVSALVLICGVGIAAGAVRVGNMPLAWAGVALLAAFAIWSVLSISWSAAPDNSWIAANRAITYAAVAAISLVAACSLRNAPSLAVAGLAAVVLLVALYALGGKVIPGFHFGPLDLNPGDRFARLREPIEYWNALGLLCVMGCPAFIWLAASRTAAPPARIAALLALGLVTMTTALTYSRGAVIAYAAMLAILVGAGPRRLPRLAVGLGTPLAMLPAMLVAFGRHDLSSSDVSLSAREGDGLILGAVIVVCLIGLALIAHELIRLDTGRFWNAHRTRLVWRGMAIAAVVLAVVGIGALALSDRGLTGEVSHQVDEFKQPQGLSENTPQHLISSNGSNRYVWWQEAIGAFKDKPLAGWGAGSFPILHFLYRRYDAPVRSAHSLPLQFLSETGLVGALLGLGGLALLGTAAVRRVRRSEGIERSARLVLLSAATAWAVHSLYDWDWEIPAVTLPALIAVCFAAAPLPGRDDAPRPLRRGRAVLAGVTVALTAAALAASAGLPALSVGERLQALDASVGPGSLEDAAADADLAHELDPLSVEPLFTQASVAQAQGRPRLAAGYLEQATETQPDNWETWKRLATIEIQLGDSPAGAAAVRRWGDTDPFLLKKAGTSIVGNLFALEVPPTRSPTAYGTPPP